MSDTVEIERNPLTKKELAADKPTWCPAAATSPCWPIFKLIQNRGLHHEKFATVAGIGCGSRFPYFVQAHGAHYIHGRALPFATGIALYGRIWMCLSSAATAMPSPSAAITSTIAPAKT